MVPASKQNNVNLLSGSFQAYRRNFGKLIFVFLLLFITLALPMLLSVDTYVTQQRQAVFENQSTAIYTAIYIFMPLLKNGFLIGAVASIFVIGIFGTPFFMGMAGKITSDDAAGRKCSLKESTRWAAGRYKHMLFAYALYYLVSAAFALGSLGLIYWLVWKASHLITDVWLNPALAMIIALFAFLVIGTVYFPFIAMDAQKGSFRLYTGSFKAIYSRRFKNNFPKLLLAAAMAGGVAFAAMLPVTLPILTQSQGQVLEYLMSNNSDYLLIAVSVVVFAFVGVFLFIFAYNTYRAQNMAATRKDRINTTYRRKIEVVQPSYRRRIG